MQVASTDLLEVSFTPQEEYEAKKFLNSNCTYALLQNYKIQRIRQLATQRFDDPEKDATNQRERAYWIGQLDLLESICDDFLQAEPPVVNPSTQQPQS